MPVVGSRLKAEREKRSLRLVDVAMAIKVGAHHLSALEYSDFDALPDDDQVLEFVRAYAEHLGLEADVVAGEYARELPAGRPAGVAARETPCSERPRPVDEDGPGPVARREEDERPQEATAAGERRIPAASRLRFGSLVALAAGAAVVVLALIGWRWLAVADGAPPLPPSSEPARSGSAGDEEEQRPTAPAPEAEAAAAVQNATGRSESPEASISVASRLTVPECGVGTGVVDRMLVGEGTRFAEGQRVWFWTRVEGGTVGESIRHVWIHDGREMTGVVLSLGGPHWRTQSSKTLSPGSAGEWAAEARDEAGRVLARREFVCRPRS